MIAVELQSDHLRRFKGLPDKFQTRSCCYMLENVNTEEDSSVEDGEEYDIVPPLCNVGRYTSEDPTETMSETLHDVTESQSDSTISLASQSEVECLLIDISDSIGACIKRKNEIRLDIKNTSQKAKARYASGGVTSALISMRRVHKLRHELVRLAAKRCKLMEIFLQVQTESPSFAVESCMVDLELEYFRSSLDQVDDALDELDMVERTDDELLVELRTLSSGVSNE